jgi:predicted amidophosphoribosyltransferase
VTPVGAVDVDGLDGTWALVAYDGVGRELVRSLKFTNRRAAVGPLARAMADLVEVRPDLVTWVPATPGHRRARGYDQGQVLARRCAVALDAPARRLLGRGRDRSQTGLSRAERLAGPALRARGPAAGTVLVVDDVVTTGASLRAAADALRAAGAARVLGLALAARR